MWAIATFEFFYLFVFIGMLRDGRNGRGRTGRTWTDVDRQDARNKLDGRGLTGRTRTYGLDRMGIVYLVELPWAEIHRWLRAQ